MPKQARFGPSSELSRRLVEERHRRGWSQQVVADKIDTTPLNVSRWERGQTTPNAYFRHKLSLLFDVSLIEIDATAPGIEIEHTREDRTKDDATPGKDSTTPLYDPAIPLPSPTHLVGRAREIAFLKEHLMMSQSVALSAMNGLPGVGKTTLALALIYDDELRTQWADGVLWATLESSPDIRSILSRWGQLLGIDARESAQFTTLKVWSAALRAAIGQRRFLFVLDDAWRLGDVLACQVGGPHCSYLVTTRFPQIALAFTSTGALTVKELNEEQSIQMLHTFAPEVVEQEPEQARLLVRQVGGLPLALTVIGSYLRLQSYSGQPRRIRAALSRLQNAQERLNLPHVVKPLSLSSPPSSIFSSLQQVLELSEMQLAPRTQRALHALSVFPAKPNSFSEEAALAVCAEDTATLDSLSDVGLLETVGPGYYTLHQVIADYARLRLENDEPYERLVRYALWYIEEHRADDLALEEAFCVLSTALQVAHNRNQQAEVLHGVLSLTPFLFARALYRLAEQYLLWAKAAAESLHDAPRLYRVTVYLEEAIRQVHVEAGFSSARHPCSPPLSERKDIAEE